MNIINGTKIIIEGRIFECVGRWLKGVKGECVEYEFKEQDKQTIIKRKSEYIDTLIKTGKIKHG